MRFGFGSSTTLIMPFFISSLLLLSYFSLVRIPYVLRAPSHSRFRILVLGGTDICLVTRCQAICSLHFRFRFSFTGLPFFFIIQQHRGRHCASCIFLGWLFSGPTGRSPPNRATRSASGPVIRLMYQISILLVLRSILDFQINDCVRSHHSLRLKIMAIQSNKIQTANHIALPSLGRTSTSESELLAILRNLSSNIILDHNFTEVTHYL